MVIYFLVFSIVLIIMYIMTVINISRFPYLNIVKEDEDVSKLPKISVVIPVYNETKNIEGCLEAVFSSTALKSSKFEVIVVDDQSTDNTLELARTFKDKKKLDNLVIIEGKARPVERKWVGKNWACWQGAEAVSGDYILFIDADVRLKKGAIESSLKKAVENKTDLLTASPCLKFSFIGERLIQPIVFSNVLVVLNPNIVNKPGNKLSFAIGPFMLFNTETYRKIGGHKEISAEVLDDGALARQIKTSGHILMVFNGKDLADLAMYDSWKGIIEGWSKNYYQSLRSNLGLVFMIILITLLINFIPWLNLVIAITYAKSPEILAGLLGVLLIYLIRLSMYKGLGFETKYWWLSWMGAFLLCYIVIISILKTYTGKNWTWRGRSLN